MEAAWQSKSYVRVKQRIYATCKNTELKGIDGFDELCTKYNYRHRMREKKSRRLKLALAPHRTLAFGTKEFASTCKWTRDYRT